MVAAKSAQPSSFQPFFLDPIGCGRLKHLWDIDSFRRWMRSGFGRVARSRTPAGAGVPEGFVVSAEERLQARAA